MRSAIVLLLAVLLASPALAQPLASFYHPVEQRNLLIERWTYEELLEQIDNARFRHFNDLSRVCETAKLHWGRTPQQCKKASLPSPSRPATTRAYARFAVLPEPLPVAHPGPFIVVDPVYPPWSPVFRPWEWPWR